VADDVPDDVRRNAEPEQQGHTRVPDGLPIPRTSYGQVNLLAAPKKALRPSFILVFGWRREFVTGENQSKSDQLAEKRAFMEKPDETLMTYDRLAVDRRAHVCCTVKMRSNGLEVVAVPPTFTVGPQDAETICQITGWQEAIDGCQEMPGPRKSYLKARIEHWRLEGLRRIVARANGEAVPPVKLIFE
jgi:hypothetical protein